MIDLEYDGFDRLARRIDQVGNTLDLFFDPVSNVVRLLRRGPPGGPTPTDRSGSSNVDLADTYFLHDELSRPFRRNWSLFVPSGVTCGISAMPACLSASGGDSENRDMRWVGGISLPSPSLSPMRLLSAILAS